MSSQMTSTARSSHAQEPAWPGGLVESNVLAILNEARDAVIRLQAQGNEVIDRNKYGFISDQLSTIMGLSSFSLGEYTYRLSETKSPGIRVWLDETRGLPTVSVILFPDVLRWRVDESGDKKREVLVRFDLSGDEPQAIGGGVCGPDLGWQECLARAFGAPLQN